MKPEFYRQIFEKHSNTKFHENHSSGSRVVPCGRTDMAKLIVAFRKILPTCLKTTTLTFPASKDKFRRKQLTSIQQHAIHFQTKYTHFMIYPTRTQWITN
jgi:hypothetical protein